MPAKLPGISKAQRQTAQWYFLASLIWFAVSVVIALFLRYYHYRGEIAGFVYKYWLHTHSHVVMLGWVYNALAALTLWSFPMQDRNRWQRYLFVATQLFVAGILLSFPFHGYFWASILFSTLHIFASYLFAYRVWHDTNAVKHSIPALPLHFLRWALFFLVFSTLGPFMVAYVMASGQESSIWYRLSIYFYLHFQSNGWFVTQMLALILIFMARQRTRSYPIAARSAIWLFTAGVLLSYAQSAIWTGPPAWVYFTARAGALLQISGLGLLYFAIRKDLAAFRKSSFIHRITGLVLLLLLFKSLLQLAMLFGGPLQALSEKHPVIIAFLHLIFLGVLTPFLLVQPSATGMTPPFGPLKKFLFLIFLTGFALMELALVLPAIFPSLMAFISIPAALFYSSLIMALPLLSLLFLIYRDTDIHVNTREF